MIQTSKNPTDIVLVTMPHAQIMRPSIALGILKASLVNDGFSCIVDYANLRFAEAVGLEINSFLMQLRTDSLLGEWIFAEAAFRDARDTLDKILGRSRGIQPANLPAVALDERNYAPLFRQLRAFASRFVDETARRVLSQRPRIVGATSTFEQHCASLALLRRIKEIDPSVTTMMGGANCESEMGWTTLKNCPWVDFVVSGEADLLIAPLCSAVLKNGSDPLPDQLPEGVMARSHVRLGRGEAFPSCKFPRAVVANMNLSPSPDFDEYFESLASSPLREFISPALAVESSRGCWWGQKSHCTFCGLNGSGMNYRSKDASVVSEEWRELVAKYPTRKLAVVDNIIDLRHVKELLPELAEQGKPYQLFYETKANLRREQVRLMADAGVKKLQPGIEALHDDLLRLMAKGNSATINIQMLKFARDYGISVVWLLLVGFPNEDPEWHREVAQWLPLVFHLQPPNGVVHIRYDRFSVYYEQAVRYGLDLKPFPSYQAVYPFSEEDLAGIAYFFYDASAVHEAKPHEAVSEMALQVKEWIIAFNRAVRPVFCYDDDGTTLRFFDSRPCTPSRRTDLTGLAREIYLACDSSIQPDTLVEKFSEGDFPKASRPEARRIVEDLIVRKLVLYVHGRILALACLGSAPTLPSLDESPNGYVEKFDSSRLASSSAAWDSLREGSPRLASLSVP